MPVGGTSSVNPVTRDQAMWKIYTQKLRQASALARRPPSGTVIIPIWPSTPTGKKLAYATVHNPDQYMTALRTIIAGGRKRIGLLIGAGASAGMQTNDGIYPLIPAVAGLTESVLATLHPEYRAQIEALKAEILPKTDIETLLSRIRALATLIGPAQIHNLDGAGFATLAFKICNEIAKIVNVRLPDRSAYGDL